MLIKLYGEFWNPDIVDWGRKGGQSGHLRGKLKVNRSYRTVDFWEARGIYVLYDDFKVAYVGKAFSMPVGQRIRDHLTDRLAGRWNMFSWYCTSNYKKTTNDLSKAGTRQISPETIVKTLESLAILIAEPPLNRRREKLPDAVMAEQLKPSDSRTIKSYLEEILKKLSD